MRRGGFPTRIIFPGFFVENGDWVLDLDREFWGLIEHAKRYRSGPLKRARLGVIVSGFSENSAVSGKVAKSGTLEPGGYPPGIGASIQILRSREVSYGQVWWSSNGLEDVAAPPQDWATCPCEAFDPSLLLGHRRRASTTSFEEILGLAGLSGVSGCRDPKSTCPLAGVMEPRKWCSRLFWVEGK